MYPFFPGIEGRLPPGPGTEARISCYLCHSQY